MKKGRKFYSKYFVIYFLPSESLRVSPIVSKKISKKAVVRNKIKRRIRVLAKDEKGLFAIIAKEDVSQINFKELIYDFKKAINKIN
ncbi:MULTISPECIES: ribonuclease P protein component [unclassified Lebetimonas]|uniref:ribonuclease P protein component n=1 Tax=unclassified Lebetimonas TaxID=2648158 RepID=UPI001EEF7AC8|nr:MULTISPECIES: ribonuclease P protein component [unclassified Lebetimonas]